MKKLAFILLAILLCFLTGCQVKVETDASERQSGKKSRIIMSTASSQSTQSMPNTQQQVSSTTPKTSAQSTIQPSTNSVSKSQSASPVPVSSSSATKSSSQNSSSENSQTQSSASKSQSSSSSSTSSGGESPVQQQKFAVIVDGAYSGNDGDKIDGIPTYKTVTKAINYLVGAKLSGDIFVNIKAGTYQEKLNIPVTLKNVKFIGDPNKETKLTYWQCSSDAGGTDQSASTTVLGDGFSASYIHFENSYDYNNESDANKQALAILVNADKVTFYKCKFSGHQDTLEAVTGRQHYKDCTISGSVDFIFGNNPAALFDNCNIISRYRKGGGGYIAVPKGNNGTNGQQVPKYCLVFKNCKLTAESGVSSGKISLARPWRADATCAYINCEMGAHISKKAYNGANGGCRYVYMNGGKDANGNKLKNEPHNAHFYEYGNTGSGAITSAVKGCTMLSKSEADGYVNDNIFAKVNGDVTYVGEWDWQTDLVNIQ